jgi:ribosomal protein L11 methyltransferase
MASLSLSVEVESAAAEFLSEALLEAGAASVTIDGPDRSRVQVTALFPPDSDPAAALETALKECGAPRLPFSIEQIADDDWVRRSQAQFAPARLGRLWIGASWHEAPKDCPLVVRLDPGLAFGTGSHASTRLVLAFLERTIHGGESVLDYGCGSGILAIAAGRLGANRIDAVDIDPQAVQVTKTNAAANGIVLGAYLPDGLPAGCYELVVANILAQPLIALAPLLAGRAQRGGRLALAGVLDAQVEEVAAAYAPWFDMAIGPHEEGWALITGRRR